jgi:hypothetical protein
MKIANLSKYFKDFVASVLLLSLFVGILAISPSYATSSIACGTNSIEYADISNLTSGSIGNFASCSSALADCLQHLNQLYIPNHLLTMFSCASAACISPRTGCIQVRPPNSTLDQDDVTFTCYKDEYGHYSAFCIVLNDFSVSYRAECTACVDTSGENCSQ